MAENKYGYEHDDGHYSKATGKGSIVDTTNGEKEITNTSCFLTSACMQHFKNDFNDKCYELGILRWFRDNFVPQENIDHYYITAPIIVEAINDSQHSDLVYECIYENTIIPCVKLIERKAYLDAYKNYKNSILGLEEMFGRKYLQERLVRVIKNNL